MNPKSLMDVETLVAKTIRAIQADKMEIYPGLAKIIKILSRVAPKLLASKWPRSPKRRSPDQPGFIKLANPPIVIAEENPVRIRTPKFYWIAVGEGYGKNEVLFCALSLFLISWDRVSKGLAKEYLRDKPAQTFLHNGFTLQYVENTGAALSMGDSLNPRISFWLLGVLPLTILPALFAYLIVHARNIQPTRLAAFSLIFAGGMGNILDRLVFDRHVTDFMNIDLPVLRSFIFNFADVWITVGVAWLALTALTQPKNE